MEIQNFFNGFADKEVKKPRKPRILHIYSRDFFDTKIKAAFETMWEAEQIRPLKPGEKAIKRLDYSNKITAQYWEAESADFKKWVEGVRSTEHERAVEEWQAKQEQKANGEKEVRTAESYQQ